MVYTVYVYDHVISVPTISSLLYCLGQDTVRSALDHVRSGRCLSNSWIVVWTLFKWSVKCIGESLYDCGPGSRKRIVRWKGSYTGRIMVVVGRDSGTSMKVQKFPTTRDRHCIEPIGIHSRTRQSNHMLYSSQDNWFHLEYSAADSMLFEDSLTWYHTHTPNLPIRNPP